MAEWSAAAVEAVMQVTGDILTIRGWGQNTFIGGKRMSGYVTDIPITEESSI